MGLIDMTSCYYCDAMLIEESGTCTSVVVSGSTLTPFIAGRDWLVRSVGSSLVNSASSCVVGLASGCLPCSCTKQRANRVKQVCSSNDNEITELCFSCPRTGH